MSYIREQTRHIGETGKLQIRGDNGERTKWLNIDAETMTKVKALLVEQETKQKEEQRNES